MPLDRKKLGRRAVTAVIGVAAIALFILFMPKWCFHLFLLAVGVMGAYEFERVASGFGVKLLKTPIVATLILGMATLYLPTIRMAWIPFVTVASSALLSLLPPRDMRDTLPRFAVSLAAAAYLGLPLLALAYIFSLVDADGDRIGRILLGFCIVLVWAGDTAAYLVGSFWGKRKIAPVVSPNKTHAGTLAIFIGNLAAIGIAKITFLPMLDYVDVLVLSLVFGVLGFFGDLIESSWKRGSGIKDSGALFPGHGGVMDRIDSIFLTAPIFYFYMKHMVLDLG